MIELNHFGMAEAASRRKARLMEAMIMDLTRAAELLRCDIAFEEERSGLRNHADPAYPMLARHLLARLRNIEATIASLTTRLAVLRQQDQAIAA